MIELQDAVLDRDMVDRLFFDVREAAELLGVTVKGALESMASAEGIDLDAARDALHDGRVAGVQLRYRFEGTEWWDTLLWTRGGIRLVRIDHDAALRAGKADEG